VYFPVFVAVLSKLKHVSTRNVSSQAVGSCFHVAFCVFYFLFSSYKRYFYCHDVTGITRWDYPDGPEPDNHIEEEQHRDAVNGAALDTISASVAEQSSLAVVFPGEPLPPGVDPPLPGALSADILALAGCPPPPPPMTPPTASVEVGMNEEQVTESDLNQPVHHRSGSPSSDEDQPSVSTIPDPDPADQQNKVEISAPPVLNRPSSPETTVPSAVIRTPAAEFAEVSSPTTTSVTPAVHGTSPTRRGTSPSVSTATDDTAAHHARERRKKKDKVTAAYEY